MNIPKQGKNQRVQIQESTYPPPLPSKSTENMQTQTINCNCALDDGTENRCLVVHAVRPCAVLPSDEQVRSAPRMRAADRAVRAVPLLPSAGKGPARNNAAQYGIGWLADLHL